MKKPGQKKTSLDRLGAVKAVHPHAWLWEPAEHHPTFVLRSMFGAKALYLHGKMMLCFTASEEPWRGVLVCTDRVHHAALSTEFPALAPHPVLPKWLYLPEATSEFESVATKLVALALRADPRLGVEPGKKSRKPGKSRGKSARTAKRP